MFVIPPPPAPPAPAPSFPIVGGIESNGDGSEGYKLRATGTEKYIYQSELAEETDEFLHSNNSTTFGADLQVPRVSYHSFVGFFGQRNTQQHTQGTRETRFHHDDISILRNKNISFHFQ